MMPFDEHHRDFARLLLVPNDPQAGFVGPLHKYLDETSLEHFPKSIPTSLGQSKNYILSFPVAQLATRKASSRP